MANCRGRVGVTSVPALFRRCPRQAGSSISRRLVTKANLLLFFRAFMPSPEELAREKIDVTATSNAAGFYRTRHD